jgi:FKBP-type peptidyl-prolyl cis-trans isomerase
LEHAQEKTKELLSSDDFLQQTLKLVFPAENIHFSTQDNPSIFNPIELNRLQNVVATNIWNNMEEENEEYHNAMIDGMKAAQLNKKPEKFTEYGESSLQRKYLDIKKNIEDADTFLNVLEQNREYTKISEFPIFYRTLSHGQGNALEKPSEVLVKYSIAYLNKEMIVDLFKKNKIEKLNLNDTVLGFALGMKGMKIGEQREILIHPSAGYGIFTSLKKGTFLKVKVQLVDIVGQENQNNYEDFLNKNAVIDSKKELESLGILESSKLAELNRSSGFSYGYYAWEHYKKESSYSLEQILNEIQNLYQKTNSYIELPKEDKALLNHMHWLLYQRPNHTPQT